MCSSINFTNLLLMTLTCSLLIIVAKSDTVERRSKRAIKSSCGYGYIPNTKVSNQNITCDICGNVSVTQNARIVGGVLALPYSWPAQVLIIQTISGTYRIPEYFGSYYQISKSFICGGTLINAYTVLTAAHCIETEFIHMIGTRSYLVSVKDPYDASQFSVYVGAYDISFLNTGRQPPPQTIKMTVKKVIRHPNYSSNNYQNDIAVYHLMNPVQFNQYVQPACLPNQAFSYYPPDDSVVFASGWGATTEGGSTPSKLYNVVLTAYSSASCRFVENSFSKNWNAQICAGAVSGGKDTCQGDSGGGLYAYDSILKKYIVSGIVSYGQGCARPNFPGVYTRVSYYYNWIMENLNGCDDKNRKKSLLIYALTVLAIRKVFV